MLLLRFFIKSERGSKICMLGADCGARGFIINSRAPENTIRGLEDLRLTIVLVLLRFFIKHDRGLEDL